MLILQKKSMSIIELESLDDERVRIFTSLSEAQLRSRLDPEKAIFIAESPKVIKVALDKGYEPLALLCERKHIDGDASEIIDRCPDIDIFTGPRELLSKLTGYTLTRGVLCAMKRPIETALASLLADAKRIVVIDGVTDTTNIGAIFRSAAALGIDAVLLTRQSCDPLNRRSIRVSMGSVFLVPWGWIEDDISTLHDYGFRTAAMALRSDSMNVDDPALMAEPRLAIIMGTEGDGLANAVIDGADYTVCIPMANNVDSLNVAAAASIAFWQLRKKS